VIQLFKDVPNGFSFSEAEQMPCIQQVSIGNSSDKTCVIKLMPSKWQSCDSVTIFIPSNFGEETSALSSIKFIGTGLAGADVSKIGGC